MRPGRGRWVATRPTPSAGAPVGDGAPPRADPPRVTGRVTGRHPPAGRPTPPLSAAARDHRDARRGRPAAAGATSTRRSLP